MKSGDSIEFLIFSLLLLFSTNCFQYLRCHIILIHINHVIFFSKHEIFWIKTAHNIIADSHFFYLVSRRRKNHSKRKKRKTCFSDKAKMLYYRFRKCQFDVFIPYVLFSSANIFGVSPNIFFQYLCVCCRNMKCEKAHKIGCILGWKPKGCLFNEIERSQWVNLSLSVALNQFWLMMRTPKVLAMLFKTNS